MINLLCLLCSFIIQFGSAQITPYNMASLNADNEYLIDEIKSRIASNYGGFWLSTYGQYKDIPNEQWVVIKGFYNNQYADKIVVCCPKEAVGSGSSSISASGYTTYQGENNLVSGIQLTLNNYIGFHYFDSGVDNNMGVYGSPWYNFEGGNWSLLYCDKPIYSGETLVVDVYNSIIITTGDTFGSLSQNGHTSGGSPLEELGNFSWSSTSATFHSSGHSTGVNPASASYDYSNAQQNLLGQIVDNTNKLLFNGHSLGEQIKTLNANIINGVGAVFNAVSQFNNNFVNTYVFNEDEVKDTIQTSNMFLFANSANEFIYKMSDLITDFNQDISQQEQIDELVIPIDLRPYTIVYFDTDGYILSRFQPFPEVYQMRFEFLDETKVIWQPLLIAILYFSLTMSIYFDLPNIIRGAVS